MVDFYRNRLKNAALTWMEQGGYFHNQHFMKDRISGRNAKRAARNEEKREIEVDVINCSLGLYDEDYDGDEDEFQPLMYTVEPLKAPLLDMVAFT